MKQVSILGSGAWGTAVATVLAHNGYTVKLWCRDPEVAKTIKDTRINKRLPEVTLPKNIIPTDSIEEALSGVDFVFEATPVKYLRSVLEKVKPYVRSDQRWVVLSKGIENETLLLPAQMIDDIFDVQLKKAVCVGPSFAHGVVKKEFTAIVGASTDANLVQQLKQLLENEYFRLCISSDPIGAQVGSALKNVIALGIGILDGAGSGPNAKAYVLTKALEDMATCAQALGGKKDTMYGLSGVGDLVLTCMGGLSRNVMVGKFFGEGKDLEAVIKEKGVVPEGVNTAKSIHQLGQKYDIKLPVCEGIYDMVFEGKPVEKFLKDLP